MAYLINIKIMSGLVQILQIKRALPADDSVGVCSII